MTRRFYHSTTEQAAKQILAHGFTAGGTIIGGVELVGVFLANVPVGPGEGAKGDFVLEVDLDLTDEQLADFEIVGLSGDATYREWCIPAAKVNSGKIREIGYGGEVTP